VRIYANAVDQGAKRGYADVESVDLSACGWDFFPSTKRLGGKIKSCWRCILNLAKNQRLGVCFRNS
jgi:hypothetical protein